MLLSRVCPFVTRNTQIPYHVILMHVNLKTLLANARSSERLARTGARALDSSREAGCMPITLVATKLWVDELRFREPWKRRLSDSSGWG